MTSRHKYRLLFISRNHQYASTRFTAKPYAALLFGIWSLFFISSPNMSIAVPFVGTATEVEFCITQGQFCDNQEMNPAGGAFDLSLAVPSNASGDATFTLSAFGDFADGITETFDVDIEGFGLGFFLNNNPGDDLFDNAGFADTGNDFIHASVASATIPLANLLAIIADGTFTATFDSSTGVNDIQSEVSPTIPNQDFREFISYQLSFEALAQLPGDFDLDRDVDGDDLNQWQGDFGVNALSDADEDNDSDGADFLVWQRQVGSGPPVTVASVPVPEPATVVLLILAAAGLCARQFVAERKFQQLINA